MRDAPSPLPRLETLLRVVALRRGLSRGLVWITLAAVLASAAALSIARWSPHTPRAVALTFLALGFAVFVLAYRELRKPLSLAMELDQRLDAASTVLTAAELRLGAFQHESPLADRVTRDATRALSSARARDAFAPLSRRRMVPALIALSVVPVTQFVPVRTAVVQRPRARAQTPPRPEASLAAATVAESLRETALHDIDHADALRTAADRADTLSRELSVGITHDQALTDTDALERAASESLDWARDPSRQRALDAALSTLGDPSLSDLQNALAHGDLTRVDRAVRRLADQREARDRLRAEESLRRAATQARQNGSRELSRALDAEADLLHRRAQATALARELAQALAHTTNGQRAAERLQSDEDRALAQALDAALRELDRELSQRERQRLVQALAQSSRNAEDPERAELDRAARAPSPEELRRALRELVERIKHGGLDDTPAGRAQRAGQNSRDALTQLRLRLVQGPAPQGTLPGEGRAGPGGGHVDNQERTQAIETQGFAAPTRTNIDPSHPGVPIAVERVDTTGTTALTPSEVRVHEAAPAVLGGVEQSPLPDGYRDQLRVYFGR